MPHKERAWPLDSSSDKAERISIAVANSSTTKPSLIIYR